jgi:hypothetical protein
MTIRLHVCFLDRQEMKNSLKLIGSFLVEAGGIEPPSEDLPAMATTRLFRELELARRSPTDGLPTSQPI